MTKTKHDDKDFSVFEGKMPWSERVKKIHKMFPSINSIDLAEVFRTDPVVLGNIIYSINKLEVPSTGKPGKRPTVDPKDAEQYLKKYQKDDFTILPFSEAFKHLKKDRSLRHTSRKCGLSYAMTQRLLDGTSEPSMEAIEKVAKAFKKDPSYFVEYRVGFILAALHERLCLYPEASVVPYLKLKDG